MNLKCRKCNENFPRSKAIVCATSGSIVCPHCQHRAHIQVSIHDEGHIQVEIPTLLENVDVNKLQKAATKLVEQGARGDLTEDAELEVFAEAMEAMFGEQIWDWLTENPYSF